MTTAPTIAKTTASAANATRAMSAASSMVDAGGAASKPSTMDIAQALVTAKQNRGNGSSLAASLAGLAVADKAGMTSVKNPAAEDQAAYQQAWSESDSKESAKK